MTRNNTNMHALDQLVSSISIYYTGLSDIFDELTVSKIRDIQNQIRTGQYTLSPLKLILNQNKDVLKKNFHHIMNLYLNDSICYGSLTTTNQEDQLVLIALGGMLNTLIQDLNLLNTSSFGYKCIATDYYSNILSHDGPISRVYKLDMTNSLCRINKDLLLTKLEPIVVNDEIMRLLKLFLYVPIHYEGKDFSYCLKDWIPFSCFITDVLLNFSLIELDNSFHERFPSFSYTRYVQEVIVTTSRIDPLFESSLFSLFNRLNLVGKIESIGPGDKPIPCYHGGVMSITDDGRLLIM